MFKVCLRVASFPGELPRFRGMKGGEYAGGGGGGGWWGVVTADITTTTPHIFKAPGFSDPKGSGFRVWGLGFRI